MKFDVINQFTGRVKFTADIDCDKDATASWKLRLAIEWGIKNAYNLCSADLRSADLRSVDLRFADLRAANLSSANLRSVDLRFANLSSADLRFADLSSADLCAANLSSADLRFADLRAANLSSANLRDANLSSANLRDANLRLGKNIGRRLSCDVECTACKGTGIYVGLGERDAYGVVCHQCKGTGCYPLHVSYTPFVERKARNDVKRVLQVNPGICVVGNADFGGMPYEDWVSSNGAFPAKSEMRAYTCPAWWYQSDSTHKKPEWDECMIGGRFAACQYFKNKEKCWDRFDKELSEKGSK